MKQHETNILKFYLFVHLRSSFIRLFFILAGLRGLITESLKYLVLQKHVF